MNRTLGEHFAQDGVIKLGFLEEITVEMSQIISRSWLSREIEGAEGHYR